MTIPMAIVDFIPVILFLCASLILMRDLYHMMSKGAFALMSGGFIVIFVAGIFKALWKLLFAAGICDFEALNRAFFPMQTTGFVLAALGLVALVTRPQKKLYAVAPFTSAMPFVALLVLGTAGVSCSLSAIAAKMKKHGIAVLFIVYLLIMLCMGYLSSRDFASPAMNWIGEGVNTAGQLLLLLSVRALDKAGLEQFELPKKAK